jgi:UMF1 family MFS transporter
MPEWLNRRTLAWACIDWANSAFILVVTTAFFPVAFKKVYASGWTPAESTFALGLSNSLAGLVIAFAAPVLGAWADRSGRKQAWLMAFTVLGALATLALALLRPGQAVFAAVVYGIALVGFLGNNALYDGLLNDVAPPKYLDQVSGLGYSLGYFGSSLLFIGAMLLVSKPELLGLQSKTAALSVCFAATALWWLIFTLPSFFVLKDKAASKNRKKAFVWTELRGTLQSMRKQKGLLLFLGAYFLYIDGVNTMIKMAVDYGLGLGLDDAAMMKALLLTQLIGVPAALLFGALAGRVGMRACLTAGILVYAFVCVWGWRMQTGTDFLILACLVGCVQGGVQALSRSAFARYVPKGKGAEYFGFFNLLGRFSTILGPTLMGLTALATQNTRTPILSLLVLFMGGLALLWLAPQKK